MPTVHTPVSDGAQDQVKVVFEVTDQRLKDRPKHRVRSHWQRWLVMLSMGLAMIAVEVIDHRQMHLEHNSGSPLWQDRELIREIIILGFMVPLAGGFLLTFLERTSEQRDEVTRELDERRKLIKEVNGISDWKELANFAAELPGRVTGALSSYLLLQAPDLPVPEIAAQWVAPGHLPDRSATQFEACHQCQISGPDQLLPSLHCPYKSSLSENETGPAHCLPLAKAEDLTAVLRFYLPAAESLTDYQVRLLSDIAPELVLAVENALLLRQKEAQDEVAVRERRRIARNLHDTLGQNISYLRLKLDQFGNKGTLDDIIDISREIERMRDVANESYEQVRETLADLQPGAGTDLVTFLQQHAGAISDRAGFACEWQMEGRERSMRPIARRNIKFIAREALNNVEKYARAQHIKMSLIWQESDLELSISDDGVGFQPDQPQSGDHYGIGIMQERAAALNGQLIVRSALNQGTEVRLRLPLAGNAL